MVTTWLAGALERVLVWWRGDMSPRLATVVGTCLFIGCLVGLYVGGGW